MEGLTACMANKINVIWSISSINISMLNGVPKRECNAWVCGNRVLYSLRLSLRLTHTILTYDFNRI